ncbi:hypothetical protein CDO44_20770 [Pigmentiphaga sp. NML080357]|uniref:Bug family tripartite tricarboxylate transporter substrate binding protein n=1 Tax=Pigmentiphaga sp. NML080357 TaxID=2008675 RepID=UPI000B419B20|nr:tripartite tricarboxylate transporter substrate binding protein [Pigmentiphaga sp. NML080357]OVZ56651.1 hypothetical protein CDO44_20770 [Pigmentiphaga sp. NML080357]
MFDFAGRIVAGLLALCTGLAQAADAYPSKPVRIVVGFPPAGGTDIIARLIAPRLAEELGQPVIVENRPGAVGTLAAGAVAKAEADGHTLLLGANSTNAIAPAVYRSLPFRADRDFAPIAMLASVPHVVAVWPGLAAASLEELVAIARRQPDALSYSSPGNGSAPHVVGETFKMLTGVRLLHVPYKGAGQSTVDLASGQVQISFDTTTSLAPLIRAGKVRALAVTSPGRSRQFPDVPTAGEAGLRDFVFLTWMGLFAPAGTPAAVVKKLNDAVHSVLASADMRQRFLDTIGAEIPTRGDPAAFDDFVWAEIRRYAEVVKATRITID